MALFEKIEQIRKEPEHIRKRYVIICLSVAMVFIIGIWLLSLKESFHNVAREIPEAAEEGKDLLPTGEGTPSLNTLLEQASPLRVEGEETKTGQEFFQEQIENREGGSEGATKPPTN